MSTISLAIEAIINCNLSTKARAECIASLIASEPAKQTLTPAIQKPHRPAKMSAKKAAKRSAPKATRPALGLTARLLDVLSCGPVPMESLMQQLHLDGKKARLSLHNALAAQKKSGRVTNATRGVWQLVEKATDAAAE